MEDTVQDGVYGTVTDQTREALAGIQQQEQQIQLELGRLSILEHRLHKRSDELQAQAQRLLSAEAIRLGIPTGTQWQVAPDGVAKAV